jgi:hypothetical protein
VARNEKNEREDLHQRRGGEYREERAFLAAELEDCRSERGLLAGVRGLFYA